MNDSRIDVIDFAIQHGLLKQSVFKILKRNGVSPGMLNRIQEFTGTGVL